MELKTKFLIYSLIGIIAGMIVGLAIWMIPPINSEGRSFVAHMIASAIHGLIPCGAAAVYDIESWGITKSTVVHASLTLATIVGVGGIMKWYSPKEFAIAMVIYVIIYTIIWLINFLYWKHTVSKMNEQLEILLKLKENNKGRA
ncbi:MAG: DUF3021 domain-containing protein [Lachnospiraceae bacterium]|nr:DUF3021 domain-containing protein [Lachnospiraceae bacterium]